jgi:Sigma-70 region 2
MIGAAFPTVLSAAASGDEDAFARLWRDLQPRLLRYLRVVAPGTADDLASETWLTVIRGLGRFHGDEPAFRVWVFTIARHRAIALSPTAVCAGWPSGSTPASVEGGSAVGVDDAAGAGAGPPALDEETAERLLAGDLDPADAPPGYGEIAAVVAAAKADASPDELAGQAAAVMELRKVARAHPATTTRRAGKRRRIGLAVAVVVGALSTGGVAAASGHLPGPIREATRNLLTTVGVAPPGAPGDPGRQPAASTVQRGTGNATTDGRGAATSTAGHGRDGPASTAAPTVKGTATKGLCQAFLAGEGKTDAARFLALAAAAGGADKIASYCGDRRAGGTARRGQGRSTPPGTAGNHGHGQGGPPPAEDLGKAKPRQKGADPSPNPAEPAHASGRDDPA